MDQNEQYIKHSTGLFAFFSWLEKQKNFGMNSKIIKQSVYCHPMVSKYFSIGIAKNKKYSNIPFIAIQPQETAWMKLIQWDRIAIRKNDMHVYFISKFIKGDKINYPDLPPFVFGLSLDHIDKLNLLFDNKIKRLDGREYYLENNKIMVNYHTKVFNLPVFKLLPNEPYLEESEVATSYLDIMHEKENELQAKYSDYRPDFEGEVIQNDESTKLLRRLAKESEITNKIHSEIEKSLRSKK